MHPELAYPTYEVGARLAGAARRRHRLADRARPASGPALVWLNSPSNPTGRVLPVEHLRKVVDWCRERGALLVSDECYLECAWEARRRSRCCTPTSAAASTTGILAVHSLSKRSNLAGYRCAFVAGDPALVGELLAVRKNLGLMMPGPQQARDGRRARRRRARRASSTRATPPGARVLRAALEARRLPDRPLRGVALPVGDPRRGLLGHRRLARRARHPGRARATFYGPAGARHVRVALTATDERVDAAASRIAAATWP